MCSRRLNHQLFSSMLNINVYVMHALKMFSKSVLREKNIAHGICYCQFCYCCSGHHFISQPYFSFSVLSKFLLHIKISCFCNILININTAFIYAPCAVCAHTHTYSCTYYVPKICNVAICLCVFAYVLMLPECEFSMVL